MVYDTLDILDRLQIHQAYVNVSFVPCNATIVPYNVTIKGM